MEFLHKIWGGDVWYGNCPAPQKIAIDNMSENKLLMSCELGPANRAYGSFKDVPDFLETYNKPEAAKNQHYYEILGQSPSLYFDLDFKISEFSLADAISNFTALLKSQFFSQFGRKLSSRHIFILSASNGEKGSLHFIIKNGYIFRNPGEAKTFVMKLNDARDISKIGNMIDLKVYHDKRAFRIIGSSKFGSDRILLPISAAGTKLKRFNPLNYFITNTQGADKFYYESPQILDPINLEPANDEDTDEIAGIAIKLYKSSANSKFHKLSNPIIKQINNDIISITFKRRVSGFCSICDRTHDNANTANIKIFLESNKIFECCHKSTKKSLFLGNIRPEIQAENDSDSTSETGSDTGSTFISAAIKSGTKFKPAHLEKFIYNDLKPLGTIHRYNEKYCSNNLNIINSSATIIGQRASMGTGKTNCAADRCALKYSDPNSRFVCISFRVSLAEQLANDKFSQIPDIKCYNKLKGDIIANKLVIQPESLHRYDLTKGRRDYLNDEIVIDEISQVRKQFTSPTFLKNMDAYRSYQKFKYIVRNSRHIHVMDANLSATDIKWIQDIRRTDSEPVEIYWNEYKNLEGRTLSIANSEFDILHQIINDLKDNKRVYIASNSSTQKILAISDMIKELTGKKMLCICSETLDNEDVKKALNDPNSVWGDYPGIICSPSVQSGISYDKPDIFDNVYGIFSNYSSGSQDCSQMLNRIRHPINTIARVSISMGNNNIGPIERTSVIEQYQHHRDHLNSAIMDRIKMIEGVCQYEISEFGANEYVKNDLFNLIIDNDTARNIDLKYFIWNFIKQHHSAGYIISEFDALNAFNITKQELDDLRKTYKTLIRVIKDSIKTTKSVDLANAVNKTITQIEEITKKLNKSHDMSRDDKLSLEKFKIANQYNTDINKPAEWFKLYGDKKIRNIFSNQSRILKFATFAEAINNIKITEENRSSEQISEIFCNPNNNHLTYNDTLLMGSIDYMNAKPIYKKTRLMLEMIEMVGFDSIDTAAEIDSETIQKNIKSVHKNILADCESYTKTLGKDPRKIAIITGWKYDDPKFYRNMLQFINGTISGELGITIGKISNHSNLYRLKNKYLDITQPIYFNNVNRPIAEQLAGPNIPDIGK